MESHLNCTCMWREQEKNQKNTRGGQYLGGKNNPKIKQKKSINLTRHQRDKRRFKGLEFKEKRIRNLNICNIYDLSGQKGINLCEISWK